MTKIVRIIDRRVNTKARARRMCSVWGSSATMRESLGKVQVINSGDSSYNTGGFIYYCKGLSQQNGVSMNKHE